MLFKTAFDSIHVTYGVMSSKNSETYLAKLVNQIEMEVFNDDTSPLKKDPTFLQSIKDGITHYVGRALKPKERVFTDGKTSMNLSYHLGAPQKVLFTPRVSGKYDVLLHNMPKDVYLQMPALDLSDPRLDEKGNDASDDSRPFRKIQPELIAGETYEIEVGWGEEASPNSIGAATLSIYLSNSNVMDPTGSSLFGDNHSQRVLSYSGHAVNTRFEAEKDGFYTIALNYKSGENSDTYLRLLDVDFREIIFDDDGLAGSTACVNLFLKAGKYYVISSLYSSRYSAQLQIDAYKQRYLPDFAMSIREESLLLFPIQTTRSLSYLTVQNSTRKVNLKVLLSRESTLKPAVSLTIRNSDFSLLASFSDVVTKGVSLELKGGCLYHFTFTLTDSSYRENTYLIIY